MPTCKSGDVKSALVCGVSGQDGAYLAKLLCDRNYRVIGTTRDVSDANLFRLEALGIAGAVEPIELDLGDFSATLAILSETQPDEVYALASQSSVGRSFEAPDETLTSIVQGTQNLLEALRMIGPGPRLFHASSSECFGDLNGVAARENTPFRPRSPYGAAKAWAHHMVATYRESYGLFMANGILFNHESPLRSARFVTRKVTQAARRIASGRAERLQLARVDVVRDWGWAPEYVEAMWLMLQQSEPEDFVLATGESRPLSDFVAAAFAALGLDWRDHVDSQPARGRPSDPVWSGGDPSRAAEELGWRAHTLMPQVARLMAESEAMADEAEELARAD